MTAARTFAQIGGLRVARLRDLIGIAGLAGCALLAAAATLLVLAWRQHRAELSLPMRDVATTTTTVVAPPVGTKASRVALPSASDVPLLLSRIERAAIDQGLGWPKAEYQVNTANNETPASLEVRCTLKGPYPSVRRFVTALLQDEPTLTLREFSLTRANIDTPDVEAKISIVVYIADSSASALEKPQ